MVQNRARSLSYPMLRNIYLWMVVGLLVTAGSFLNIFFRSSTFDFIISPTEVVVFMALTAVGARKIVIMVSDSPAYLSKSNI